MTRLMGLVAAIAPSASGKSNLRDSLTIQAQEIVQRHPQEETVA
jgi:hypothetical protein